MRPVNRGEKPVDGHGNDIKFTEYSEARGELISRMGQYCSYCEMLLPASLAVEHVQPKKPPGSSQVDTERALDWNNFLLACTNCNSTKSHVDVDLDEYFWPDQDNTFLVLSYSEGGIISPNPNEESREKAIRTIKLTGLDKYPSNDPRASDRRWMNRREAWDKAQRSKNNLSKCCTNEMKDQIVMTAISAGFWSVWMTVFRDDEDMLRRFLKAFPGTCIECFDADNRYAAALRPTTQR